MCHNSLLLIRHCFHHHDFLATVARLRDLAKNDGAIILQQGSFLYYGSKELISM